MAVWRHIPISCSSLRLTAGSVKHTKVIRMNKYKKFMAIKYAPWMSSALWRWPRSKQFFITNVYVDRNWWHKKGISEIEVRTFFVIWGIIAMQFHKRVTNRKWYIKVTIASVTEKRTIIVIINLNFYAVFHSASQALLL